MKGWRKIPVYPGDTIIIDTDPQPSKKKGNKMTEKQMRRLIYAMQTLEGHLFYIRRMTSIAALCTAGIFGLLILGFMAFGLLLFWIS